MEHQQMQGMMSGRGRDAVFPSLSSTFRPLTADPSLKPQVDVVSTMKDVLDITKSLLSRKVQLVDEVGDVPSIVADADRLVQIMYNLIGNAGVVVSV